MMTTFWRPVSVPCLSLFMSIKIAIDRIDHLVLTVLDIQKTVDFYSLVLGMRVETFGEGRFALRFGNQKINLHSVETPIQPHANAPIPGAIDLCLITSSSMEDLLVRLGECHVTILEGPVPRTGALGPIRSVYFRDPDLNLIEVSSYDE